MKQYRMIIKDAFNGLTYTKWVSESDAPYDSVVEWIEKMVKFDYLTFELESNEKKIYFPNSILSIHVEWRQGVDV